MIARLTLVRERGDARRCLGLLSVQTNALFLCADSLRWLKLVRGVTRLALMRLVRSTN